MFGFSGKQIALIIGIAYVLIFLNNRGALPGAIPKAKKVDETGAGTGAETGANAGTTP